jgi:NAD(P)-dependent dehydrogenase (short-subunit alcohol dehydrogenase family)
MSNWTPADLPDLTGKIAIITGGHSGLGLATSTALAAKGCKIYIASRSQEKVDAAIRGVKEKVKDADMEFLECDLGDLSSVQRVVKVFLQYVSYLFNEKMMGGWERRRKLMRDMKEIWLHILINNAGIMCHPYEETKDGWETQWQTNYLSHFLLTSLLLPTLLSTAKTAPRGTVRVVNVSSDGHAKLAPRSGIDFQDPNLKRASVWTRYGHSKLALVLHAKALGGRVGREGVLGVCLHPGTVRTGLAMGWV